MAVIKKGYDWKITAKKLALNGAYVVLAGLAAVYGQSQWYLAIAPALMALENFIKHALLK